MRIKQILYRGCGVLVGIYLVTTGVQEHLHYERLHSTGTRAVLAPITKYTTETGRKSYTTYTAEFHFVTAKGQPVMVTRTFPKLLIEDFVAGRPVQIRYDQATPSDFIFERDEITWLKVGLGIAVGMFVLLSFYK